MFVSHRGVDAVPAERLAKDLKAAGQDVWLDVWEIA
ncbi:TIR domain-containing protein, partial [Frankia sp. Cr1]